MIRPERRRACSLALITAFVLLLATPLAAVPEIEWLIQARTPAAVPAGPALPDLAALPVQLVLDDGTFETVFGVGGVTARQFLWFTQFALPPGAQNLSLQEIWVLFPPGANMVVGDAIELVVYQDFDGDPTNGANLLATVDETIQTLDGTTFSVYSIPPVEVVGGGDVLIGVVSRFIDSGVTPFPTLPAAVDASVSDGSGWFASWTGDPPNPPELPSDLVMQPFNASFAGVWMIRAFGRPIPDYQVVPSVGTWGLIALALALAFAALRVVRGGAAGVVVVLAVATLGVLAGPAEATVVDDFAVAQAPLTDPPGSPDTSSVAAGLGAARDLFVDRVAGGGSVSAEVAMGALDIDITDDAPDTRGEVVASWDGADGDPALDPIGLGGLDLTVDGGTVQTGFDLDLISAVTGVEVTIEVFTDAANASRIDLVLISTQTSYVLGYDDFVASLGVGADFSNVGAIVMTIRATEKAVSVDRLATTGPVVVGLLADALVAASDADMDGNADPGDVLRYTATISNTGTEADDVDVADTLTDLTFVPGSVRTTPIARNDRYDDACGNVTLTVAAAQGVLANDFDIDTNALGVDVAMSDTASVQGATVTMAADGGFVYSPPPGFGGVDSFGYQLALVAGDPTPPAPIRGTVTLLIDERVWFVDNDHAGTNQGTQANPFLTLVGVEAVAQAGDTIFIFEAANTTGLDTGLVLENDQRVIGHGVDLVACGQTLVVASARPTLTHGAGIGITLAENNTIRGLNIDSTDQRGISGSSFGTATINNLDVTDAGEEALHLTDGILAATLGTLSATSSAADGVMLDNVGGSLLVTGTTTITNPTGAGVTVQSSPAAAAHDFGATTVTLAGDAGGAAAPGVQLATNNASSLVLFDSLAVTTENGPGLMASSGGMVTVTSAASSIVATTGAGLDVTSTAVSLAFATLSSAGSPTTGVNLNSVTGTVNATGGSIGTATGNAFDVNAGTATVTYGGSITNDVARAVEVTSLAGGTITFTGAIDDDGTGIRLDSNGTGSVTFRGGMTLDTGANTAFTATGGGTFNVCATADCAAGAAVINTIGATTALSTRAVEIDGTTIGGNGVTFRSISVDGGGTAGIRLADTGAGSFSVTGDGTTTAGGNGSGGTIENITGADAITLDNTDGLVNFQNIIVEDIADAADAADAIQTRRFHDGIHGQNVDGGLRLQSVTMRRFSDHAVLGALFSDGTDFTNWNGLELRDSTFENANRFHVAGRGDDADEGVIRIRGLTGTVVVDNCIVRLGGRGLDFYTPAGGGTLDATVQRSSFTDLYKEFASGGTRNVGGRGVSFEARGSHDMVVRIGDPAQVSAALGNTFTNNFTASVVVLGQEGGTSPHTGDIDTVISRNDFIITDHTTAQLPFGNLTFDFPQGGLALVPGGGTYDAIVSHNLFDEVMHAAGGIGQLTLGLNGGDVQAHVHNNEFRRPWDGAVMIRAEGTSSAAVLFEDNIYTDGMVGSASDDVGFATQSPFNPVLVNVRAGGALDLTMRREVFPQHDTVFTPADRKHSIEIEVQADSGANELDLHLVDNMGPEGYHFKEFAGSFELFMGVSASAVIATIVDDNGNTGGAGSDVTDPPTVVVDGGVSATGTAPTLPVIVIP